MTSWRTLNEDERWQFRKAESPPPGKAWGYSPARVLVEVDLDSLEHGLMKLKAPRDVFDFAALLADEAQIHPCALADGFVAYKLRSRLLALMERSVEATAYVLALVEYEDTAGLDNKGHIREAKDWARVLLARRAALEALE